MAQGEYRLKISADSRQFGAETREVIDKLNRALPAGVGDAFGRLGSALTSPVGAITSLISAIAGLHQFSMSKAAALQKMATGAELSTTQAQAISMAAREKGIEPEVLLDQLEIIKQKQSELAGGNVEVARSFEILGYAKEQALTAEPFDIMLKIFEDTKKGEGGMRAFAAAVALLGRTFRSELAPLARRGLGSTIAANLESPLIIPEATIQRQAERKREEAGFWSRVGDVLGIGAQFGAAPFETAIDYVQAAKDAEFEARQRAAKLEDPKAKAERLRKATEIRGLLTQEQDTKTNQAADKLRLETAEKARTYQLDGLGASEKRLAIEKEIAKITFDLEHDKLANELEVQQARSRVVDLTHQLSMTGRTQLPEPDTFSHMGLFLTPGAQTYSRIFGMQDKQLAKLDAILRSIDALPAKIANEQ